MNIVTPEMLFNIFSLYGHVVKIKLFLKMERREDQNQVRVFPQTKGFIFNAFTNICNSQLINLWIAGQKWVWLLRFGFGKFLLNLLALSRFPGMRPQLGFIVYHERRRKAHGFRRWPVCFPDNEYTEILLLILLLSKEFWDKYLDYTYV